MISNTFFVKTIASLFVVFSCTGLWSQTTDIAISGNINSYYPDKNGIPGIKVYLKSGNQLLDSCFTNKDGEYRFNVIRNRKKLTVHPVVADEPPDNLNAWDLFQINQHILGLKILKTPFHILAADVDGDQQITTQDISGLQKLLLDDQNEKPTIKKWQFVAASWRFDDLRNPFLKPAPAGRKVRSGEQHVDFTAVRKGYIGNTAYSKFRSGIWPKAYVSCFMPPQKAEEQFVTIPVIYKSETVLDAIQMDLQYDTFFLELVSPSPGDLAGFSLENFGLNSTFYGRIHALWYVNPALEKTALQKGTMLFYLTFKVLHDLPKNGHLLTIAQGQAWSEDLTLFCIDEEPN